MGCLSLALVCHQCSSPESPIVLPTCIVCRLPSPTRPPHILYRTQAAPFTFQTRYPSSFNGNLSTNRIVSSILFILLLHSLLSVPCALLIFFFTFLLSFPSHHHFPVANFFTSPPVCSCEYFHRTLFIYSTQGVAVYLPGSSNLHCVCLHLPRQSMEWCKQRPFLCPACCSGRRCMCNC